jgi:hypothetical protein
VLQTPYNAVADPAMVAPSQPVIAGLDPAIHLLRKKLFTKIDGCADQARA